MPVCDRCGKLPKADRAGLGRVGTAGRAMGRARGAILQGQRRKGLYGDTIAGPTKARMRFGGIKIVQRIRKPWEGKRPAGSRREKGRREGREKEEVSVGLVRRRETPHQRRTDTGVSVRQYLSGGVNLLNKARSRRARRWHTEVWPSYHFRVRTEVNSTTFQLILNPF
ncbi:hypothetical protein BY996DRAFT_6455608 [Phakopsora pachyrhizi]|nr:hypothetical protein BY996DRAFT_6455608 [Phakopsora pachyrhizi]